MEAESTQCPRCGCAMSQVVESRSGTINGYVIRVRVRVCRYCHKMFRTKEVADESVKLPHRRPRRVAKVDPPAETEQTIRPDIDREPPPALVFPP